MLVLTVYEIASNTWYTKSYSESLHAAHASSVIIPAHAAAELVSAADLSKCEVTGKDLQDWANSCENKPIDPPEDKSLRIESNRTVLVVNRPTRINTSASSNNQSYEAHILIASGSPERRSAVVSSAIDERFDPLHVKVWQRIFEFLDIASLFKIKTVTNTLRTSAWPLGRSIGRCVPAVKIMKSVTEYTGHNVSDYGSFFAEIPLSDIENAHARECFRILYKVKYRDQGWGNRKGEIYAVYFRIDEDSLLQPCKWQYLVPLASHAELTIWGQIDKPLLQGVSLIRLYAKVGSGGGHSINISEFAYIRLIHQLLPSDYRRTWISRPFRKLRERILGYLPEPYAQNSLKAMNSLRRERAISQTPELWIPKNLTGRCWMEVEAIDKREMMVYFADGSALALQVPENVLAAPYAYVFLSNCKSIPMVVYPARIRAMYMEVWRDILFSA